MALIVLKTDIFRMSRYRKWAITCKGKNTMSKMKVDYMFIVLVYRNTDDVVDLLKSISELVKGTYIVIIVNNYYDRDTAQQFEKIAKQYRCEFINCENRGYGAGNNAGIRLALERYEFDFLIISNPDIVLKQFPEKRIQSYKDGIIGGAIYNLRHKNQNPMIVRDRRFVTRMTYLGLKKNAFLPLFISKAINKAERIVFDKYTRCSKRKSEKVYQIHGSFLIFTKAVIEKIGEPYDENMFLFGEEGLLAYKLREKNIPTYYCPMIEVLHKEDGSMKFRNDINEECVKACLYFYEKYYFRMGD